jgi:hypothetical protein
VLDFTAPVALARLLRLILPTGENALWEVTALKALTRLSSAQQAPTAILQVLNRRISAQIAPPAPIVGLLDSWNPPVFAAPDTTARKGKACPTELCMFALLRILARKEVRHQNRVPRALTLMLLGWQSASSVLRAISVMRRAHRSLHMTRRVQLVTIVQRELALPMSLSARSEHTTRMLCLLILAPACRAIQDNTAVALVSVHPLAIAILATFVHLAPKMRSQLTESRETFVLTDVIAPSDPKPPIYVRLVRTVPVKV